MFTNKTSLIIPTKDRANKLFSLLFFFKKFKINFNQIIVVDSSILKKEKKKIKKFLENNYLKRVEFYESHPSSSFQRNLGLKKVKSSSKFVMFMDDDVKFYKNSFVEMNRGINKFNLNDEIIGFGFNLVKKIKKNNFTIFKNNNIVNKLGLYSQEAGVVMPNGWHTKINNLKKDTRVEWIFTGATVYISKFIKNLNFDESFGQYSYLEDLDFSLSLTNKKKRLVIICKARFKDPHTVDRNNFEFGVMEIRNRFIIVDKHKLSKILFIISSFIRFNLSIFEFFKGNYKFFLRATGNFVSIIYIIKILIIKFKRK
jgi:hypothetical protein